MSGPLVVTGNGRGQSRPLQFRLDVQLAAPGHAFGAVPRPLLEPIRTPYTRLGKVSASLRVLVLLAPSVVELVVCSSAEELHPEVEIHGVQVREHVAALSVVDPPAQAEVQLVDVGWDDRQNPVHGGGASSKPLLAQWNCLQDCLLLGGRAQERILREGQVLNGDHEAEVAGPRCPPVSAASWSIDGGVHKQQPARFQSEPVSRTPRPQGESGSTWIGHMCPPSSQS